MPKPTDTEPTQSQKNEENDEHLIGGYHPADLLAAPIKPPEPVKTEGEKEVKNPGIWFLMAIGIILFALGILLTLLFNGILGIIVILLGGAAVLFAVFGRGPEPRHHH